jgi:hypothetical protein
MFLRVDHRLLRVRCNLQCTQVSPTKQCSSAICISRVDRVGRVEFANRRAVRPPSGAAWNDASRKGARCGQNDRDDRRSGSDVAGLAAGSRRTRTPSPGLRLPVTRTRMLGHFLRDDSQFLRLGHGPTLVGLAGCNAKFMLERWTNGH